MHLVHCVLYLFTSLDTSCLALVCRTDPHLRRVTAAEALHWLMQHQDVQQQQAKEKLVLLQQTRQISVVGQETDLSNELSNADLSIIHLQLVNAAPAPKFGQPLNVHYTWWGLLLQSTYIPVSILGFQAAA